MTNSDVLIRKQPIDEMTMALRELGRLLMDIAADERKKELLVARLTEMDMEELGISKAALSPEARSALFASL